jgi:uncharacterized protein YfaS (alpha-2-macroglobulin family)
MAVGGRHLWFPNEIHKKSRKKSLAGLSSQTRFVAIAIVIIVLSQGIITALDVANNTFNNTITGGAISEKINITTDNTTILQNYNESTAQDFLNTSSNVGSESSVWQALAQSFNTTPQLSFNTTIANESREASKDASEDSFTGVDITIDAPRQMTRNEVMAVSANITANIDVNNVVVEWILPPGMEVVSESGCDALQKGSTCIATAIIRSSLLTEVGSNNIKVKVSYGS